MRAVFQVAAGEPVDVLEVRNTVSPTAPGPGEALVRVVLAPVHHGDLFVTRSAQWGSGADGEPELIPRGSEAVGVIEAIGRAIPAHDGLKVGARVAVFPGPGIWRERIVVPVASVVLVPSSLPDDVASMVLVNGITARMILRRTQQQLVESGEGIVIQSAAGALVAQLLATLLRESDIPVINLVRRSANTALLSKQFPDIPVVATDVEHWQQQVHQYADGRPVAVAVDCVGGTFAGALAPLVKDGGAIVTYGGLAGGPIDLTSLQITSRELGLKGVSIGRWFSNTPPELRQRDVEAAVNLAVKHSDLYRVAAEYPLEQISEAVVHVERPGKSGAVLLRISDR